MLYNHNPLECCYNSTVDSNVELFCNFYNLQWPMGLHFNNVSGSCVTETSFFVAKLKVLSADKLI